MKKCLGLAFLVLAMIHYGASAPKPAGTGGAPGKPKKSQGNTASVSPQGFAADQIVKFFGRKTGRELMLEKAGNVAGAGAAATKAFSGKTSARTAPAVLVKPGYVPPPPTPHVSVPKIRQEIQKILDLNKKIKNVQGGRAGQFQRVQEQARLHQKILNDLESATQEAKGRKIPRREDLLAQEKLRIIHEETQRNADLLETADSKSATVPGQGSASPGSVLQFKKPGVTVEPVFESGQEPRKP